MQSETLHKKPNRSESSGMESKKFSLPKSFLEAMTNRLPDDIDPKILPLVKYLRENGVRTIHSCQGGEGHSAKWPEIAFLLPEESLGKAWLECERVSDLVENLPISRSSFHVALVKECKPQAGAGTLVNLYGKVYWWEAL